MLVCNLFTPARSKRPPDLVEKKRRRASPGTELRCYFGFGLLPWQCAPAAATCEARSVSRCFVAVFDIVISFVV
jgi:hypothetical protein